MTTIDWDKVKTVVLKDSSGKTLKTDPEIWCGGYLQWPTLPTVAVPHQTGQTGTIASGTAIFNINTSTDGVNTIVGVVSTDTSTHYATFTIKSGYRWADSYTGTSRRVQYSLKQFTKGFYVAGTYFSVTGFNPSASYTWGDAYEHGALTSSFTTDGGVGAYNLYYNGKLIVDSNGYAVTAYDTISGSYSLRKPESDFDFEFNVNGGYVGVWITDAPSGVSPTYTWTVGSRTLSTNNHLYIDIDDFTSTNSTLRCTISYPESTDYAATTKYHTINVYCASNNYGQVDSAYTSTCKARHLRVGHNTNYVVFRINGTPSGSGYKRYSFRRSTNYNESTWGSSTYFRRYYLETAYSDVHQSPMAYASYNSSTKKWQYGGTTSAAWYDNLRSDGKVQIWLTNDSGNYCFKYFGTVDNVSIPN